MVVPGDVIHIPVGMFYVDMGGGILHRNTYTAEGEGHTYGIAYYVQYVFVDFVLEEMVVLYFVKDILTALVSV